jgi:uncharacterized protein (UPF0335 family)
MAFFHQGGKRHTVEGQRVMHLDRVVSRIILLAKLPGNNRRAATAEELRTHLEDLAEEVRSQGYDEEAVNRIVRMRFGEADEIAGAFASVYAPERLAKLILQSVMLVTASTMAVVVVIGAVQLIAAICTGISAVSILRGIHQEVFGFGAVTAGYCSVYAGERIFPTSLTKALLLSATLGVCLAAVFGWLVPQHAALPLAAFACAAAGRLFQRVEIPFVWFAGTALPLLMAWALFGPLISGWQFPWLVWVGLTVSCKALREIVRLFERLFVEEFA